MRLPSLPPHATKHCGVRHGDVHIRLGSLDPGGGNKLQLSERGTHLLVPHARHLVDAEGLDPTPTAVHEQPLAQAALRCATREPAASSAAWRWTRPKSEHCRRASVA